jgi:hypothetical protein
MGAAGRWKDRISEFWIFPAWRQLRLAGAKTPPGAKMQLVGAIRDSAIRSAIRSSAIHSAIRRIKGRRLGVY